MRDELTHICLHIQPSFSRNSLSLSLSLSHLEFFLITFFSIAQFPTNCINFTESEQMGIGNYNQESIHDQKSIFLPMFCRLSIKDVKLSSVAAISAADPSSPTVTCIGQVKRSNRITPSTHHHHHHQQTRPRKPVHFSRKTVLPNPPRTAAAHYGGRKSGSRSSRLNREICVRDSRRSVGYRDGGDVVIDVSKMDPPLPVVKRAPPPGNGREEVNIWRRRFEGVKSMQIEPIHLPEKRFPAVASTDLRVRRI